MTRDVSRLSSHTFDLLVVGGGVYGLTLACDAAQRGLSVALIERNDFGSGTSFNHFRTIHGGLRYLQTLDVMRSRESVRERRTLARIAPHTVQPLLFALPLYRSLLKGKLAMRLGFQLDRLVSWDRNQGVAPMNRLAAGRVVSKNQAIDRFPGLQRRGLTGAATWFDYVTLEADRLTFSWALAAAGHGATLANRVEANRLAIDGRRVTGVHATDRATGRELQIAARLTANVTGSAIDQLLEAAGLSARMPLLKAMNVVTRRDAGPEALGGRSASGRNLFLVPWRGRAVFGTWESPGAVLRGDDAVKPDEVESFLTEINQAFPNVDLKAADVSLVHRGLVPAAPGTNGSVRLQGHEQVRDHSADGFDGLMSLAGTKYTTARAVAERVTDRIVSKLGAKAQSCRTSITPLPGGDVRDVIATIAEARRLYDARVPSDTIPHLVAAYGSRYRDILELTVDRPEWRARLADDSPVIGAEIVWAARHEMATALTDAVIRRTPLGALGYPGDEAATRAAAIMSKELKWSEEQTASEIHALREFYKS